MTKIACALRIENLMIGLLQATKEILLMARTPPDRNEFTVSLTCTFYEYGCQVL